MSSSALRKGQNWTDDSKRRNSSTAGTISSGRRRSSSSSSGRRSSMSTLCAIRLTVVSCPAKSMSSALLTSDPWDRRPSGPSSLTIADSIPGPAACGTRRAGRPATARFPTLSGTRRFARSAPPASSPPGRSPAPSRAVWIHRGSAASSAVGTPRTSQMTVTGPGRRTRRRRRSGSCPSCRRAGRPKIRRISDSKPAIMWGHSGGPKCRVIRRRSRSCSGGSASMIVRLMANGFGHSSAAPGRFRDPS